MTSAEPFSRRRSVDRGVGAEQDAVAALAPSPLLESSSERCVPSTIPPHVLRVTEPPQSELQAGMGGLYHSRHTCGQPEETPTLVQICLEAPAFSAATKVPSDAAHGIRSSDKLSKAAGHGR